MVLGAKKAIQHVPSKGRISIMKIQNNFTVQRRQSALRAAYGSFLVIFSIVLAVVDPIDIFTKWFMDVQEGKFIYRMWNNPTYDVFSDVYVFNYTNVENFLSKKDAKLHVEDIGPFKFREIRKNENLKVDKSRGVMTMNPKLSLQFLPEQSVGHYKDINITVPNVALLAISTLLADQMNYFVNAGAYYSLSAMGTKLFRKLTAQEMLWGHEEPLVALANTLLPGWIDFGKLGIMDRFYAQREEEVEVELKNVSRRFSINMWNNLPGMAERGYTTWNTSTTCNRVKGRYEGLLFPHGLTKGKGLSVFRKQACGTYLFDFYKEMKSDFGFNIFRYKLNDSAFSRRSEYVCSCDRNCVPDGFVDISSCYYGFPITLSKPYFEDADPVQQSYFRGFSRDLGKFKSKLDIEPVTGVVQGLSFSIQINIAVRTSIGNPITKVLKDRIMPLVVFTLYCKEPPSNVVTLLWLRLVLGPPLLITLLTIFFIIGTVLALQGFHRLWRPSYHIVQEPKFKKNDEKRKSSILNIPDNNCLVEHELAKEAVSLLALKEEDNIPVYIVE